MASRSMPTHNGPPIKSGAPSESPSPTLYVTDLPEKLHKPDLRLSLYTLFSTYGPVLDVVAVKTKKMRGQAHIVFRDIQTSTQAMRDLQGFEFFGKEMKIQYAKGRSAVFQKLEGVYRPPNAPAETTLTDARQALFNAPIPSAVPAPLPSSLPPRPPDAAPNGAKPAEESGQGLKRRREDESDEEEAPMEEDDEDVPMEASSDED